MDGTGEPGQDGGRPPCPQPPCPQPSGQLPPGQRAAASWKAFHYGRVPTIDPDTWSLTLCGATREGGLLILDLDAVEELPRVEVTAGLHCVDRHSVPEIRWGGVRMRDVIELAPPEEGVRHVLLAARRGYASSVLLEDLLRPDALLATHADGEPLALEHGWPARVVLPHLYGFKGPKWVAEISYHHTPQEGYWEARGYHARGRVDLEERWAYQE